MKIRVMIFCPSFEAILYVKEMEYKPWCHLKWELSTKIYCSPSPIFTSTAYYITPKQLNRRQVLLFRTQILYEEQIINKKK